MVRQILLIPILFACCLSSSPQQPDDPDAVLNRGRNRLLADLERLPRYTCVQTITRKYYSPPFHLSTPSCKDVIAAHDKRTHSLGFTGWDRLRLDVAVADATEVYSWVGAPRFEEGTLAKIAGTGPLGSGDFGPFLGGIFKVATIKFQREQLDQERHLLEFSYDVPEALSKYQINFQKNKWFAIGYSGTFLLDREDPDLVKLSVRTAELRQETGKCQAVSEVEYGRLPIHGSQALIPRETHLLVIGRKGEEAVNDTVYSNCHEYASKSVLHFDTVETETAGTAKPSSSPLPNVFPAGIPFEWRLVTPIDSDTAAAGDPVEAVLRAAIRDKKGATLAPAGTRLHGRLLRVAQHSGSANYIEILLQFETIELNGTMVPFSAEPEDQSTTLLNEMHSYQYIAPSVGVLAFIFRTDHLKLDHLDVRSTTGVPVTRKAEADNKTSPNPAK